MNLELRDGRVTIDMPGDVPQKVSFTNIASKVMLADAGKNSEIDVSMQVADGAEKGGEVSAKGKLAAEKKGWRLKDGDFDITISKLQLASLKPLFALAGQEQMDMSGELNANATIRIADNALGQVKADATITEFAQGTGEQRIAFQEPVSVSTQIEKSGDQVKIEGLTVVSQFCNLNCTGTTAWLLLSVDLVG
jgi:hypothetical protein